MATVGELLKKARIEQNIEISDVERETRIKTAFIKALEEGQYGRLPSAAYAQGFLKNYAQFLGLDTQVLLALFRREFEESRENKLLPSGLSQFPARRMRVTSLALMFTVLVVVFLSYFFFQYKGFLSSPPLTITSPSENEELEGDFVTVSGKTDPDAQLFINNEVVAVLGDGTFTETVPVFKGGFAVSVTAKNRFGRESHVTRTIKVR